MLGMVGMQQIFVEHSNFKMVIIRCLAHRYWMDEITTEFKSR